MDVWDGLKDQPRACLDDPSVVSAFDTSAWRMGASLCRQPPSPESSIYADLRRIAASAESIDARVEEMAVDVERLRSAVADLRVSPGRARRHHSRPVRRSQSAPPVYKW